MNKRSILFIGLILSLLLVSCSPAVVTPTETEEYGEMSVSGSGKVYLTPDVAYINIGVQSESENVAEALNMNNEQAQAVANALIGLGVAQEDIQTTAFNVYPQMQYSPMGEEMGTKYMVDNTVYITVHDLQNLGTLLDTVVRSGANSINGISFDVTDKQSAISEARELAIQNAKSQAEELAAASGVEIVRIKYLSAYTNNTPYTVAEAKVYDSIGAGGNVPVSAGQLIISVDASITYAIK